MGSLAGMRTVGSVSEWGSAAFRRVSDGNTRRYVEIASLGGLPDLGPNQDPYDPMEEFERRLLDLKLRMQLIKEATDAYNDCVGRSDAAEEFKKRAAEIPNFPVTLGDAAGNTKTAVKATARSGWDLIKGRAVSHLTGKLRAAGRSFILWMPFTLIADNIYYTGTMQALDREILAPRRRECKKRIKDFYGVDPAPRSYP
jgi:hypothetical protein